ncbi:hypothetical protein KEM54_006771 [Ascosphaera aggregata]|nr:hypothetical protein KEM54_006771 [Ascosphaera aggregata]
MSRRHARILNDFTSNPQQKRFQVSGEKAVLDINCRGSRDVGRSTQNKNRQDRKWEGNGTDGKETVSRHWSNCSFSSTNSRESKE